MIPKKDREPSGTVIVLDFDTRGQRSIPTLDKGVNEQDTFFHIVEVTSISHQCEHLTRHGRHELKFVDWDINHKKGCMKRACHLVTLYFVRKIKFCFGLNNVNEWWFCIRMNCRKSFTEV